MIPATDSGGKRPGRIVVGYWYIDCHSSHHVAKNR